MKKVLLFASIVIAALALSCNKVPPVEDAVTISTNDPTVSVEGGVVSIAFNSTVAWTAKSNQPWVTITPSSGEAGNGTIKASVLKNETNDNRTAEVTITAGTKSAKCTITQSQLDALIVKATDFEVPAEGGTVEIPVSANVDYSVVIPDAIDWITVTKGLVDSKVVLEVAGTQQYVQDETTYEILEDAIVRTATITVSSGGLSQKVTIGQKAFYPYFEYQGDWAGLQWSFYDGAPVILPQEGGTFVIDINTNIGWRAYMSVYDATIDAGVDIMDNGWCKLDFDTEAATVTLTVQPNESYFPREDYLYTVGIIDGQEDGNFGGLGWFQQAGIPVDGAGYEFAWSKTLTELGIPAAYNRLAYTATGALLVSDGEKVHAISPADGTYWKAITYPGITPSSICSDDAGNVLVAPNVQADIDWETSQLLSGTEFTIYYSADPNVMTNSITVENKDYGVIGGIRVRGDISKEAVITGVAGSASCWFGYDIKEYEAVPNYYGTQNQGPGPGPNTFWTPETAAAISVGTSLHDGVLFRGYDGLESLCYLSDAYTPNWAVPYDWKLLTNAGNGGNENQNNLALADYNGKRILAYTQGFHFDYSSNAAIYVLDVTDLNDVKPLVTINPVDDIALTEAFTGANSADVLLHPTDECLELYVVNSGRAVIGKYKIVF